RAFIKYPGITQQIFLDTVLPAFCRICPNNDRYNPVDRLKSWNYELVSVRSRFDQPPDFFPTALARDGRLCGCQSFPTASGEFEDKFRTAQTKESKVTIAC